MKYLITKSQISNIIFKYLDSQEFYVDEYKDGFLFFESYNPGPILISVYRGRYDGYINSDLVSEVSRFFSIDMNVSLQIIGEWVHSKIDFPVIEFYSDYGAD